MTDKKKIMIGIPFHKVLTEPKFQLGITNLAFYLVQNGYLVDINYKEGTVISSQRNALVDDAVAGGYDLLQLDTDMEFSPPDIVKIIECDLAPVVGGLYFANRKPHQPLVFKENLVDTDETCFRSYKMIDIPEEPFLCVGVAIGVSVIRLEVMQHLTKTETIQKLGRPFNYWQLPNGRELGEDLSFVHRCNIEDIQMACVPNVRIGHIGKRVIHESDHLFAIGEDYHYCNTIPGWMNVREQNWLFKHAKKMDSVIEIGSWKGKSTHALCCGCATGKVTAIDHFVGTEDPVQLPYREKLYRGAFKEVEDGVDIYEIFKKNTACFNNLEVIKMSSMDAYAMHGHELEADMIFIDGGHNYEEVMEDLNAWEPRAKKLICGHDYSPGFVRVVQAVDNYFKGKAKVEKYETIWSVDKEAR